MIKLSKTDTLALARKLWELVTTTPGVGELADPLQRAEYHFDRLSRSQRVTVGVLATIFAEYVYVIINKQTVKETDKEGAKEAGKEASKEAGKKASVKETSETPDAIYSSRSATEETGRPGNEESDC